MTYNRQQVAVDFIFRVANFDEIAITGLSLSSNNVVFDAVALKDALQTANDGVAFLAAMGDLMDTAGLQWAPYSQLTDVKFSPLGLDGELLDDAYIASDITPASGVTQQVLPQSSVVLSLRSATTLGTANYGRMFLPHTKLEQATGSVQANTTVTGIVSTAGATFINTVNANARVVAAGAEVMVMSKLGTGTTKPVTRVAVGSITDTQRRRRNRLPEIYSFTNVA